MVGRTARSRSEDSGGGCYLALIRKLPLRPIRSEDDLDRAIAMADALSDRAELSPDEHDYLLVLSGLIEGYEDEHHPIPAASGVPMLATSSRRTGSPRPGWRPVPGSRS